MFDPTVPCKKCGNKVPASHLKLDYDIGLMVCPECIKNKQIHKEIEKEVFHKNEKQLQRQAQSKESEQTERVGHTCVSCGYKFKVNPQTKTPKNCPYCNSRILGF